MPALDQVVQITITEETSAVAQPSFGIPLIVGPSNPGWTSDDVVHVYSSASELLTDGFISSNPEYIYASELMASSVSPTQFMVGRRSAAVAQVDALTVNTLTSGHVYKLSVNGTEYSFTAGGGDTQQSILTALRAAIVAAQPVTGVVSGTGGSASLALTSATAGQAVTYSGVDAQLTLTPGTPNNGIGDDMAKIQAQNDTWYGWLLAAATDADILQGAAWTEGQKKRFFPGSATTAIGTSASTDVASKLKTAGYKRTALLWSIAGTAQGSAAAWVGGQLPLTPGSNTWAFKTLPGISADTLTSTQRSNAIGNPVAGIAGKNANIYTSLGGLGVTQMGTSASGDFIDVGIGVDWLEAEIQSRVWRRLATVRKVPYTDAGVAVLMSEVRAAIDQGVVNGLIDPAGIEVSAPGVLDVSANRRAQRIAPPISFTCRLQGAFHAVVIDGTVTV